MSSREVLLEVENVSKKFCRGLKRSLWYGLQDLTAEFLRRNDHRGLRREEFWALKDVSFEVRQGETLGLIGRNGAGKSTLLKLLNGLIKPDLGRITTRGRVGALIALGAGFNPILTGRENIYINAAVLGLPKREVEKVLDDIVDFADISDFIDTPVSYYSSGMHVRLGFAIAIQWKPDILLVDEVLAVGDMSFQRKCLNRIKELQDKGTAIVFVSHNMYLIQGICSTSILLNEGTILCSGEVSEVIREYEGQNSARASQEITTPAFPLETTGTGEVRIVDVQLKSFDGERLNLFSVGESIFVEISYVARKRIYNPVFSIGIVRKDGLKCGLTRTKFSNIEIPFIEGKGEILAEIEEIQLNSGHYVLEVAVADESIINPYVLRRLDTFTIVNPPMPNIGDSCGIYFPTVKWDVSKVIEKNYK